MPRPLITGDPLETIEGRWILRILLRLKNGEHRFSDLKSALPRISSNVLTERIRALESAGLVERHFLPPPAASQVYALTSLGAELGPALEAIEKWQSIAREHGCQGLRED
uniref:winged helix-turn-helix transcriptional regulator n=1 Tax=Altererythrobacter segetis TaxID=1104773 RepID=UPI00140CEA5B|nr:helix-turn-helix domain-containing protein [Altererythrobacter segetis]